MGRLLVLGALYVSAGYVSGGPSAAQQEEFVSRHPLITPSILPETDVARPACIIKQKHERVPDGYTGFCRRRAWEVGKSG